MTIEKIIFYLLLIDSISANIIIWVSAEWYTRHFRTISRLFPAGKGWTLYYLILVLWIGSLLFR